MIDALLVSDQHLKDGFVTPRPARQGRSNFLLQSLPPHSLAESCQTPIPLSEPINSGQTFEGYDLMRQWEDGGLQALPVKSVTIGEHLARGKEILGRLASVEERAQKHLQLQDEMEWLAENRHKFIGQWIALQGKHLLAAGATAKEVYARVADVRVTPPLVIRVDTEDLPFGGW